MKRLVLVFLATAAALAAVAAQTSALPASRSVGCGNTRSIGLLVPLSGPLPFLGREQANWARLAVSRFNATHRANYQLVERDTGLDPATAASRAQQLAALPGVLGVVGPAGSDEVPAVSGPLSRARLAYVSGSAVRKSLTNGGNPGFFRVVPDESLQAPTDADYILSILQPQKVLVVDDGTAYSLPLAAQVERLLKARRVDVAHDSVPAAETNFAPTIARIDKKAKTVVFVPWQSAARAERFGEQLRAKNRTAAIFGTDTLFSADFRLNGSYVSLFAPDLRKVHVAGPLVREYNRRFGAAWSAFGTPAYVATQVVLSAVERACRDGRATRNEVRAEVAATVLRTSALGIPISFTRAGDLRRARYWIYREFGGRPILVQ